MCKFINKMNSTVIKELQTMQWHKGLEGFDYHRSLVGMRVFADFFIFCCLPSQYIIVTTFFDIFVLNKKCILKKIGVVSPMQILFNFSSDLKV
jgi:hypothetical protein